MIRPRCRAIFPIAISLGAVLGNWNDTSTGIDLNKLPQFPLSKIRSGRLKDGSRITFDGISATGGSAYEREVRLRGVGKSGKRWEAHLSGLDEIWRADLDGNGTQDYVFFGSGPYFNGRTTPLFSLSILLMDREGMPVPFFTAVYHGENSDGIKHLVDLRRDGRAELLISTYDEAISDVRVGAFCSGHWTNQLYRFKDLALEEIQGEVGGMNFPLVHEWTDRGCEEEERPFGVVQPPTIHEHGTTPKATTTIRRTDDVSGLLTIDPVSGCNAVAASVIVYDRPHIREIAFPNLFTTYSADLADKVRRDGARVELRGTNPWGVNGTCTVNLILAH